MTIAEQNAETAARDRACRLLQDADIAPQEVVLQSLTLEGYDVFLYDAQGRLAAEENDDLVTLTRTWPADFPVQELLDLATQL